MAKVYNLSDENVTRMDEGITDVTGKSELVEHEEKESVDEVMDFEGNYLNGDVAACMGWNNGAYPRSYIDMDDEWDYTGEDYYWENQFDYIMIADINIGNYNTLPLYVGLLMKDDMVSAITFYNPTAG